jgi:hypothetical protein
MMTTHDLLFGWLDPASPDQADLGSLKRLLAERGVNGRGWRLCLDYGDALFSPLEEGFSPANLAYANGSNAVAYLRLLQACEMDVLPPPELVASLARWHLPSNQLSVIPPLFFRAAWKACVAAQYSEEGGNNFIETEVVPLASWFFSSGSYESINDTRLKAGWMTLMRLRREWFIAQARTLGEEEWPPILSSMVWDTFRFSALFSEAQLEEEGNVMGHCIGTYADRCRSELLRIYSVRHYKTGVRVATLSAKELRTGHWEIDQIKGPNNADVEQRLWRASRVFLDKLGYVSSRPGPVRQFLDGLRLVATDVPEEWVDGGF